MASTLDLPKRLNDHRIKYILVGGMASVIHQNSSDQHRVIQTMQTPEGSRNLGLDPTSRRVFMVSAKFGPTPAGARRGPVLPGTLVPTVVERDSAK